jgi:hypothetical protein
MDWITKIRNSVDTQFHYTKDSGTKVVLEEMQETAICKEVTINKESFKTFTIELDKRKIIKKTPNPKEKDITIDIHPLLQDGITDLKKQCDYVIFCQKDSELFVLVVELKSNQDNGWTKQTYAGEHVAKYLLAMVENYEGVKLEKVNFRHILFSNDNANNMQDRKKKKTTTQLFDYNTHEKFSFLYVRKPCNTDYDLGIFLR